MGIFIGLFAVFGLAIALTVRIGYMKNSMDGVYKFFNVVGVLCLSYSFLKWRLVLISIIPFGIAYLIKRKYKKKYEDLLYGPLKNRL